MKNRNVMVVGKFLFLVGTRRLARNAKKSVASGKNRQVVIIPIVGLMGRNDMPKKRQVRHKGGNGFRLI